ncbi:MAG: hypothetical protein KDD01_16655 [Phaeodactylibacter sp.]|nr:hypothetical protein [Phaeodactylibacter sp.]
MINFKELISVTLVLFSVIDIVGPIPILIGLKKKGIKIEAAKASAISLLIMTIFLYGGEALLHLFGIILLAIAIKLFRDNFHLIITPTQSAPVQH